MAEVAYTIPGATVCTSMIHWTSFFTSVPIDTTKGSAVFLSFRKQTIAGKIWVEPTEISTFFQRGNPNINDRLSIIEACAGIGAMGNGFTQCGVSTTCYNDFNPRFCQGLRTQTSTPVVEGDLNAPNTIRAIHEAAPEAQFLSGGTACQSFSALGDQRQQHDSRSSSFTGLLTLGYYLKCLCIFMECTKEVMQSTWAQGILNQFCLMTGFQCSQSILDLHHIWPSFRTRWWAVIFHPSLGVQSIPPVPKLKFDPGIVHLLPSLLSMPDDHIAQLRLSLHEAAAFHSQPRGLGGFMLDVFKAMPTATHSWGNQLQACACGCRAEGFHVNRIQARGLYAVLVSLGSIMQHKQATHHDMRHLHPQEVALLCGLFPSYVTPDPSRPLRLDLAGVGQMASPIQSEVTKLFYPKPEAPGVEDFAELHTELPSCASEHRPAPVTRVHSATTSDASAKSQAGHALLPSEVGPSRPSPHVTQPAPLFEVDATRFADHAPSATAGAIKRPALDHHQSRTTSKRCRIAQVTDGPAYAENGGLNIFSVKNLLPEAEKAKMTPFKAPPSPLPTLPELEESATHSPHLHTSDSETDGQPDDAHPEHALRSDQAEIEASSILAEQPKVFEAEHAAAHHEVPSHVLQAMPVSPTETGLPSCAPC
eukprot:s598_g31.t1